MNVDKAFLRGVRRIKFVSEFGKEGEGREAHTCACISNAIVPRTIQLVSGFSSEFAFFMGVSEPSGLHLSAVDMRVC